MHAIRGSERAPLPGAVDLGDADPSERLEATVLLRRRDQAAWDAQAAALSAGRPVATLSRAAFAQAFGADPKDADLVRAFAGRQGLAVVSEDLGRRTMILSGTVKAFNDAFGVRLRRFSHPGGAYRGRTGAIQLPDELAGAVEAVLGLDNRPQATPHFRRGRPAGQLTQPTSYAPAEVAALYGFPDGDGAGQCVGIIELGGGYKPADLSTYFAAQGITAAPTVLAVSVDHALNHPSGGAQGPDGEVMLDIEVVGSAAPAATIVVYFAPNTDAGFLDAVTTAAHDTANNPSVISISWGGSESTWTAQAMTAFDQALQSAAVMGVTVCIASGDDGSSDGAPGGNHVNFPASSPSALACGGTRLQSAAGAITGETVWNDGAGGGASGGGQSVQFGVPVWQNSCQATPTGGQGAPLTGRGVPDVSGDADPETGYAVRVDGTDTVVGGTSAVAPLWAGLIARINANLGKPVGFINPRLYAQQANFRDVTAGNNGAFEATPGWDACTGLGSPDGTKLTLP